MARSFRTSLLTVIFGILLLGASGSPASAAAPDLRVDGNVIRDRNTGEEFVPHGVNWPSFEYACQQGWGYSNLGAVPATAQAMLSWKINTVRLPLNQDCWLGEDGLPNGLILTSTGYRNAVESFVDDLTAAGIAVIVDLHWSAPPGYAADGLRPMADSRSDDFWVSVADRFKDNPAVIFDLFNEPHSRWDPQKPKSPPGSGIGDWDFRLTWNLWRNGGGQATNHADTEYPFSRPRFTTIGMAAMVSAVRSTGATQPILLGGLDYSNDLSEWLEHAPEDGQLIAGFHNYPGQRCGTVSCWNSEIATLARDVPVLTGEIGQSNCRTDHIESYIDWADDFHIGYLAWAWWDLDLPGDAPSCSNYALIDDLDGTPTPEYGVAFRNHLLALPNRLPPVKQYPEPPVDEPPIDKPPIERVPRSNPRLKIVNAVFKARRLRADMRVSREGKKPLSVRIKVTKKTRRGRKSRNIRLRLRTTNGRAQLKRAIPRTWKPVMLTVTYPGDQKLLPGKATRRPKVAPRK